ncbi:hypothetical protein [Kitasatospora sp. NPDC057015]|uniref:hypothetical protein n=1 Tax=Kitasatospora sp. NPDC057015 TaxID=3346001 RepID=UPI003633476F
MGEQEPDRTGGAGSGTGAAATGAGVERDAPGQGGAAKASKAPGGAPAVAPGPGAAGRAKLVFGDPLDQQSGDDTDRGWGERPGAGESAGRNLDWYLSQRPPHHGG